MMRKYLKEYFFGYSQGIQILRIFNYLTNPIHILARVWWMKDCNGGCTIVLLYNFTIVPLYYCIILLLYHCSPTPSRLMFTHVCLTEFKMEE